MRTIDSNIVAKLQSEELKPFYLLTLTINGTNYRYTDCDIPIYFSGSQYESLGFKVNAIRYSAHDIVDNVLIEIDNLDSIMTSLFVGGNPQNSEVILSMVILNQPAGPVVGSDNVTLFQGNIDSWELNEERLKITVVNKLSQWSQTTTSKYSASCRWKIFNSSTLGSSGIECTSTAGGAWCDRTYTRCINLNGSAVANSIFGGFRWLPSIVDKDIWWGRIQQ